MKQKIQAALIVVMAFMISFTTFFVQPEHTYAQVDLGAKSAILVDAETGKILFEKEADMTLPPASMTKMMTEYLVLEAIEEGKISWDTTTQISDYPYSISANPSFSGIGLTQNKDYTVRELYEAMAIISDNATTIALAELIAGSEGEFVKMMNEKAEEMGLPDYQFVNSTGLENADLGQNVPEGTSPDGINQMSARTTALLAYHLVKDYPEALEISSQKEIKFEGHQDQNLNWMLPEMPGHLAAFGFQGMEGLKTGYTDMAGYCFTGTAERDGQRLISVVMKTDSKEDRFQQTRTLMEYGFTQFETKELYPEGFQLEDEETAAVDKGKEDEVEVSTATALKTVMKKGEDDQYSIEYKWAEDKLNKSGELTAPIKKGDKVGTAQLVYNGEESYGNIFDNKTGTQSVDLVADETVEKNNWFMLMLGAVGDFFSNIFTSAVDTVKGWF
ncbi:serine hydrolase [Thalassobacillus hwangdonensis]|uniref:serine-type D-Ala-D-Ala carboxypeptidase n=1 Tax=Thalassobacillus hwangdonensis TaxID=546108 RepID=A0ABW3KZX4_9BACI